MSLFGGFGGGGDAKARSAPHNARRLHGINNPDYTHYVVVEIPNRPDARIESGWEYEEDAQDRVDEVQSESFGGKQFTSVKVITRRGLIRTGLTPDNDGNWLKNDWYKT